MTVFDHLFVIVLAIIYPVASYLSFRRLLRRIDAGEPVNRSKLYLHTIASHWTLFLLALALWYSQGRQWDALGFGLATDTGFIVGLALTATAIILLAMQMRQVAATNIDDVRGLRGRLGKLAIIIPRNGNELGRFYGLSLTAGIVEETLWRGFIIWYFSQFLPLWAAALVSVVGFGLGHAYQGIENLPKVTLIGASFVALFLLTGSLWLPIFLHTAVDIMQGRLAYDVMRRSDDGSPSKPDNGDAIASSAS